MATVKTRAPYSDGQWAYCPLIDIDIVSHRRVGWLGYLSWMPNDRLLKRVIIGHIDGTA